MLRKCCTQYASKFGKLSSGHRTGKGQFSFQSRRRAMPKCLNYSTIVFISHASKIMLKILQVRLQQYVNFQMFKLDLGKAEEPEIKLPTSSGSSKKQESSRKTSISALLTMPKPCVYRNKLANSSRDGNTRPPDLPPEKSVCS